MKKYITLSLLPCLLFLLVSASSVKDTSTHIEWLSIEEAVKRNKKEPRKFFIDVYTDWCGWCKKMDKNTFEHPEIAKYIRQNYYAVKFNAEQKESIEFANQTFKFVPQGQRGYHEFAIALTNGKLSYPTVVFLDEQLQMIQPIPGYQTKEGLEPILHFFAENKYKNTKWDTFVANFKSSIKK